MHSVTAANVAMLPATPGSYLLLFHIKRPLVAEVGRLGVLTLVPGSWIYAGSAWGSGGLRARLTRHFRSCKRPHWHIDALSRQLSPVAALAEFQSGQALRLMRLECVWTQALLAHPLFSAPLSGFGSSDCRSGCPAHLIHSCEFLDLAEIEMKLGV